MAQAAHRSSIGSYEIVRKLDAPDREIYVTRRVEGNQRREYVVAVFDVPAAYFGELEREIARCRRLRHPAIARVVEIVEHEGNAALVFESVAGAADSFVFVNGTDTGSVPALHITCNFFDVLGLSAKLGRIPRADSCSPGGPAVAVVSEALWTTRFGGDPNVIGHTSVWISDCSQ